MGIGNIYTMNEQEQRSRLSHLKAMWASIKIVHLQKNTFKKNTLKKVKKNMYRNSIQKFVVIVTNI